MSTKKGTASKTQDSTPVIIMCGITPRGYPLIISTVADTIASVNVIGTPRSIRVTITNMVRANSSIGQLP